VVSFPSGFPTKTVHGSICVLHVPFDPTSSHHRIIIIIIIIINFNCLHVPLPSSVFGPNIALTTTFCMIPLAVGKPSCIHPHKTTDEVTQHKLVLCVDVLAGDGMN